WPADGVNVEVDAATIRAKSAFPDCSRCGAIARPNILMFGDWKWDQARCNAQHARYSHWLRRVKRRGVVAIEIAAGLAIPTVRRECENQAQVLVRINPREANTPAGGIPLSMGALEALQAIDVVMRGGG